MNGLGRPWRKEGIFMWASDAGLVACMYVASPLTLSPCVGMGEGIVICLLQMWPIEVTDLAQCHTAININTRELRSVCC